MRPPEGDRISWLTVIFVEPRLIFRDAKKGTAVQTRELWKLVGATLILLLAFTNLIGHSVTLLGKAIETDVPNIVNDFARFASVLLGIAVVMYWIEIELLRRGVVRRNAFTVALGLTLPWLPTSGFFLAELLQVSPTYAGPNEQAFRFGALLCAVWVFLYALIRGVQLSRMTRSNENSRTSIIAVLLFTLLGATVFGFTGTTAGWFPLLVSSSFSILVPLYFLSVAPRNI